MESFSKDNKETKEPKETKETNNNKDHYRKRDSIFSNESIHGFNSVLFLASEFTADSDSETFIPIKKSSDINKIAYMKRNSVQIQPTNYSSFNFGVNQGIETFNPESSKFLPNYLEEDKEHDSDDSNSEDEKDVDSLQIDLPRKPSIRGSRRFSTPVNYIPMFGNNNDFKSTIQTGTESLESKETQADTFKFQEIYGSFNGHSPFVSYEKKNPGHKQSMSISINNPSQTNSYKVNYKTNTPFSLIANTIPNQTQQSNIPNNSNTNIINNFNNNFLNPILNSNINGSLSNNNSKAPSSNQLLNYNHSKNNSLNISQNSNTNLSSFNSPINPTLQRSLNGVPSLPLAKIPSANTNMNISMNTNNNLNNTSLQNNIPFNNNINASYSSNFNNNNSNITTNTLNSTNNAVMFSSPSNISNYNCMNNITAPYKHNNQNLFLKQNLASPLKKQIQAPVFPFQQPITMNTMVYQNLLKSQKKSSVNPGTTPILKKEKEIPSVPISSPSYLINNIEDKVSIEDKRNISKKDKNKKSKQQNARDGDWICFECQNLNFSFRIECNKCSFQRPITDKDRSERKEERLG